MTIYLASQSPRRRQLLDQLGIAHQLLLPTEDEDAEALEATRPGEPPDAYVQRVARDKLAAARQRLERLGLPPAPILCADTTVALGASILGKPVDAADATGMLRALAGRSHHVHTAIVCTWPTPDGWQRAGALSTSEVEVAPLPDDVVDAYVASGEPYGKAGAYAIQGAFAAWIPRIAGSHSGIMGLPLYETSQLLRQACTTS